MGSGFEKQEAGRRSGGIRQCSGEPYRWPFLGKEDPAAVPLIEQSRVRRVERLVVGSLGDPWGREESARRMRRFLKDLAGEWGRSIWLLTRSSRVERDLDCLHVLRARHRLLVSMLFCTLDEELSALLEPGAESPQRRLEALGRLSRAGIETGAVLIPLLPAINDSLRDLELLFSSLSEAGIGRLQVGVLRLRSEAGRETYFDFLRKHQPERESAARRIYREGVEPSPEYQRILATRLRVLREKYGLISEEPSASAIEQLPLLGGPPMAA